jgi:hypothetical protein
MTLNQVIARIKNLSLAHKQVRNFYQGLVSDFLKDKTTNYPSVFIQDNGGNISTGSKETKLSYRMFLLDLVNVSENSKTNEQDVQSDMVSVAMDLIAEMNAQYFDDWSLSPDNQLQLIVENDNDLVAGCMVDFSIRIMFKQNLCEIPTEAITGSPIPEDMKLIYDLDYTSNGTEGTTLNIPGLVGKRILLIIRENNPLHRVSNNPGSTNYLWDDTIITLGLTVNPAGGERFLILFRNY